MKTVDAIRSRRAVKHYDANHDMTEEEVNELLSLAVLSPTAFNIQNWRFVVVTDPALSRLGPGAGDGYLVVHCSLCRPEIMGEAARSILG